MTAVSRVYESTSEWLTPDDAAMRLGVSLRKLQYLAKSGEVPRRREGRRSFYLVPCETELEAEPVEYVQSIYRPSQGMSPFPQRVTGSVSLANAARAEASAMVASGPSIADTAPQIAANTNRTHDITMEVAVAPPPVVERVYALERQVDVLSAELSRRVSELDRERARIDELQDELDRWIEQDAAAHDVDHSVDDALMQALLQLPPATQHSRVTDVQSALGLPSRTAYSPTGAYVAAAPNFPPVHTQREPERVAPPSYDEAPLHAKLEQQRHEAERNEVRDALESALAIPEPLEPTGRERIWQWLAEKVSRAADWALGRKPLQ